MPDDGVNDGDATFKATTEQRLAISVSINAWLTEVERAGTLVWQGGTAGHVGTYKLRAEIGDLGVSFLVERSIEESL